MTVPTERRKARFEGNDAASVFPLPFKLFNKNELSVFHLDADGIQRLLRLDADYSVRLNQDQNANPGGSITYPLGDKPLLQAGESLTLLGNLKNRQETALPNHGPFNAKTIENAFDRNVIMVQQLAEMLMRAFIFPASDPDLNTELPTASQRAGKALVFLGDGSVGIGDDNYKDQARNAAKSAAESAQSAHEALTSEQHAKGSEDRAHESDEHAAQAAWSARRDSEAAEGSAQEALNSQDAAAKSEAMAKLSEQVAKGAKEDAMESAARAENYESGAGDSAMDAALSAMNAAQSESEAAEHEQTARKIVDEAEQLGTPADGSVTEPKIAPGAVTTDKIGVQQVTGDKIGYGAVDGSHIYYQSIEARNVANGMIEAKLGYRPANTGVECLWNSEVWELANINRNNDWSFVAPAPWVLVGSWRGGWYFNYRAIKLRNQ